MDTYIERAPYRTERACPRLAGQITALLTPDPPMLALIVDVVRDLTAPEGYEQIPSPRFARVAAIVARAGDGESPIDYLLWYENELVLLRDLERRPNLAVAVRPADQLLSEQEDLIARLSVEACEREEHEHRATSPPRAKGARP